MDLGIEGRVAVVTGGSRGIGEAVVAKLEEAGARVLAVSRGDGLDVTAPDAAERVAERAGALFGMVGLTLAAPLTSAAVHIVDALRARDQLAAESDDGPVPDLEPAPSG